MKSACLTVSVLRNKYFSRQEPMFWRCIFGLFLDWLFDYRISVRSEIFDVDCSLPVEVLTEIHLSNGPASSRRLMINFQKKKNDFCERQSRLSFKIHLYVNYCPSWSVEIRYFMEMDVLKTRAVAEIWNFWRYLSRQ